MFSVRACADFFPLRYLFVYLVFSSVLISVPIVLYPRMRGFTFFFDLLYFDFLQRILMLEDWPKKIVTKHEKWQTEHNAIYLSVLRSGSDANAIPFPDDLKYNRFVLEVTCSKKKEKMYKDSDAHKWFPPLNVSSWSFLLKCFFAEDLDNPRHIWDSGCKYGALMRAAVLFNFVYFAFENGNKSRKVVQDLLPSLLAGLCTLFLCL